MTLIIRKKDRYYQIGWNQEKRWKNIIHLGTPEKLLKKLGIPIPEEYQIFMSENALRKAKKYQKNNNKE